MPHTPRFGSVTLNQEHYDNPQIGDGWQEHFCYHFVVVDVFTNGNVVIVPVIRVDQGQIAQYDKAHEITKMQFHDEIHYRYGSLRNTFSLDVVPGQSDVITIWKEQYNGMYLAQAARVKKTVIIAGFRGVGKSQVVDLCQGEKRVMEINRGGGIDYYYQLITKPPVGLDILLLPAEPMALAALETAGLPHHTVYPHPSLCSGYLHRIHQRGAGVADVHLFKAGWMDAIAECHYHPGCVHWQLQDRQYLIDILPKIIHMEHLDDLIWESLERRAAKLTSGAKENTSSVTV